MDLSQTKRIVLLIDLHPLLHLPNPNPYINPILSTIKKLLSFPPLSSSLSAFKLFFSSLSPILSTSKVHHLLGKSSNFLSFDRPLQTLNSLFQTLNSLNLVDPTNPSSPDLSTLARFLLQLEHDYAWEPESPNPKRNQETLTIRSNLVLLFSPIYPEYLDVENLYFDAFLEKFLKVFVPVKEKSVARDIHFSWVDVNFDGQRKEERLGLQFLERGIKELGWGFYSMDAIVLGSALVPFGLIFPYIGCTMVSWSESSFKKGRAELVLGIKDVSGEPLECKICILQVIDLKLIREKLDAFGLFSNNCDGDIIKVHVREVWRKEEGGKVTENSCGLVLLRGVSDECRKESAGYSTGEFFADRVLQLLCTEKGDFSEGKPVWQLLLAFLFSRHYWASVSISGSDGNSLEGILKPFTVNYALLSVVEKNYLDSCQLVARTSAGSSEMFNSSISAVSKSKDGRRKRIKMHKSLLQDVTWSSFYEALFSQDDIASEMDLAELYFAMESNKSKKFRFLKCWMSQIKKSSGCCLIKPNDVKEPPHVDEEVKEGVFDSQQELEPHVSSSPARGTHLNGPINEEASAFSCLEDFEAFIGSIPQKIEHGLCSEEVDLQNLAERLVGLSINAPYVKFGKNSMEDSVPEDAEDASNVKVAAEVSCLLLVKPKDLMLKYKSFNSASHASDQISPIYSTENKIREHELQILFRMEILRSKIATSLEENVKQKMIKEICSLLQNIEFYLQGDFFCGESLLEFAGRTIKSRYANSLGDVIHKIYDQMEFFSFDGDEVEVSDSLPCSNNEELKMDKVENDNTHRDASGLLAEASSSQNTAHLQQSDAKRQQRIMDDAHEHRLMKARARRDRARRFSSFTSWVPDLQRVWALKQPRAEKPMHECISNIISKRKRRETESEMVCETPMTGKRHSHGQEDGGRGTEPGSCDNNSCRSLSKALFQHEGDFGAGMIS